MFPKTARNTTIHTEVRNHWDPITSSHGFNASGTGKHCSMILLKTNIDFYKYNVYLYAVGLFTFLRDFHMLRSLNCLDERRLLSRGTHQNQGFARE